MKLLTSTLLMASAIAMTAPAHAQFAKAEDAIKYRQSAMFIMGQEFGRVAGMAQGRIPFDAKTAADSAATAEMMAKIYGAGFQDGSDQGAPNKANPDIWKDKAKFADLWDKNKVEMAKLAVAAKTGNLDSIKGAVGGVGQTCKGCHDAFRNK